MISIKVDLTAFTCSDHWLLGWLCLSRSKTPLETAATILLSLESRLRTFLAWNKNGLTFKKGITQRKLFCFLVICHIWRRNVLCPQLHSYRSFFSRNIIMSVNVSEWCDSCMCLQCCMGVRSSNLDWGFEQQGDSSAKGSSVRNAH